MTTNTSNMQNHFLLLSNIEFHSFGFTICFHTHKHYVPGQTCKFVIKRQTKSELCLVVQLLRYIAVRGKKRGYVFQHPIGTPIARSHVIAVLNAALVFSGLSPSVYKGHSFRIGSCTWHMQQGFSDTQLRSMGRWRSSAFLSYIRP